MSIYKLPIDRQGRMAPPANINISLKQNMYQLGDAIVRARVAQGCDLDLRTLPVHRTLRWSVRRKLVDFFDDLALDSGFVSMRAHEGWVLLTAPGVFLYASGYSKSNYISCGFSIWAESR